MNVRAVRTESSSFYSERCSRVMDISGRSITEKHHQTRRHACHAARPSGSRSKSLRIQSLRAISHGLRAAAAAIAAAGLGVNAAGGGGKISPRLCACPSAPLCPCAFVPLRLRLLARLGLRYRCPPFHHHHGARRIFAIQVTPLQPASSSLSPLSLCPILLLLPNANASMIVR